MTEMQKTVLRLLRMQLQGQIDILGALLEDTPSSPRASYALPERCAGHEDTCALTDEDARISRGSFSDPQAWQCQGCGHREGTRA